MAPTRLSRDALAAQLDAVELAESLFPGDDELVWDDDTAAHLPTLRAWIEASGHDDDDPDHVLELDELAFTVRLGLDQQDDLTSFAVPLSVRLSLRAPPSPPEGDARAEGDPALALPDGTRPATIRASQPTWMSRTAHDELCTSWPPARLQSDRSSKETPTGSDPESLAAAAEVGEVVPRFASNVDLLLATIDHIRSVTPALLPAPAPAPRTAESEPTGRGGGRGGAGARRKRPDHNSDGAAPEEFRVWFWLPSLSTREKRDDMVNWAPEYNLTGFVLAG